jgi:carbon-monoxide dehydrogenase large subunit
VTEVALLRGASRFVGDLVRPGDCHLRFVVSTAANARIRSIDCTDAASAPGVVAVFTATDLDLVPIHEIELIPEGFAQPPLASGTVRFAGEYLAAVLADSPAAAVDGAERVVVEYERLEALDDPGAGATAIDGAIALDGATELDGATAMEWKHPAAADAFEGADVAVTRRVVIPRVAVAPMEGRAARAEPGAGGRLTLWLSTQSPHWSRVQVARSLRLAPDDVRVVTPDVGGGFGGKANGGVAAYVVTAAVARALGRAVVFVEDRDQNLLTMQGRGLDLTATLYARRDASIVGLTVDEVCDAGAYPSTGAVEPGKTALMACGPYRVPAVRFSARSVVTTRAPTGAYRGPGRSEAAFVLEHCLQALARELDLDPVEVRRRNLFRHDELPHSTVTGAEYDEGDYHAVLDALLARADYEALRAEQRRRQARQDRHALGIGVSTVIDSTAWFARQESACVAVDRDGTVRVTCGTASAGQQHGRAYASIVAEVLPVDPDDVVVVEGDTVAIDDSGGTSGSRSLQLAGTAVHEAAIEIWAAARDVAATLLEAAPDDIVVDGSRAIVRGVPTRGVTLGEIAARAGADGQCASLDARCAVDQPGATYTCTAHLSVVEVDVETGGVTLRDHVAVTDCGRVVDEVSARGQVVGATVQGIAQAVFEAFEYDELGNPRTTSLAEYLVPAASEVPAVDAEFVTTLTPHNALGARGVGEVGMVGAPPAVHAAILDALAPWGVTRLDLPCRPEQIWRALRDAVATADITA